MSSVIYSLPHKVSHKHTLYIKLMFFLSIKIPVNEQYPRQ